MEVVLRTMAMNAYDLGWANQDRAFVGILVPRADSAVMDLFFLKRTVF